MRDAGHRTPDIGRRTSDGEKSKNNISTPQGGGHNQLDICQILLASNASLHNNKITALNLQYLDEILLMVNFCQLCTKTEYIDFFKRF